MNLKIFRCFQTVILIPGLVFICRCSFAQHTYFIESGTITFEQKVNMYTKVKNRVGANNPSMQKFYEEYRKEQPQFYTSKSMLVFSKEKSMYLPLKEDKQAAYLFSIEPWLAVKNTVYRDFSTDSVTIVKKIYEEDFLIRDRKQNILWKMTNEMREIAGYQCKRANGIIQDSIYVVAFYSEEIMPSGGPASFSGLPGMILGIALPHENVTWFATEVKVNTALPDSPVSFPKNVKPITRKEYESVLQMKFKNWMQGREELLKVFLL